MKERIKSIIRTLIIIAASSIISVTAVNFNSSNISYCKDNNENPVSVKEAIDTLYSSVDVATITPVGSILPYIGTTAPTNYLICDGTTYNIADYKKLADFIKDNFGSYNFFGGDGTTTFAVPDLRGEFLRGAGANSHTNQGNGASVGVHQDGTEHHNTFSHSNGTLGNPYDSSRDVIPNQNTFDSIILNANINRWTGRSDVTAGTDYSSTALYTSRPTNTSVNYIIKVK